MKRLLFLILVLLTSSFVFAQTFHISKVEYEIEGSGKFSLGTTNRYALEKKVPVDTKTYFETEDDFNDYLVKYTRELNNTRAFERIEVGFYFDKETSTHDNVEVILNVYLKDSFHLIALPHLISYNSNEGWRPKLKAKDSNFMGSLNTMSADFYSVVPFNSDNKSYELGAELEFNLPFKVGIFDTEWINDYTFSYNFDNPTPEWEAKTGIKIILPFDKINLELELNQYAFRNYEYVSYGDETYFKEEAILSAPITLYSFPELGKLLYTPFTEIYFNWDKDSINIQNNDLSSPTASLGQTLSLNHIDWFGNYRKGLSAQIYNEFIYYFQRMDFIPYLACDFKYYNYFTFFDSDYFNKLGIVTHLYTFSYFNPIGSNYYYGEKVGALLRGIRDDQTYADNTTFASEKVLNTSNAVVLNIDLPYHIFTTHFENKIMSLFNCDVQVSPFLDIALYNNRVTGKSFSLKDGFYAGGFEVLVYPKKWSSFTVRGSLGLDLGRYLFKNQLNMDWRKNVSKYEISVGLGLHY